MERFPNIHEEQPEKMSAGMAVRLIKRKLETDSSVSVGQILEGTLARDLEIGRPIVLVEGSKTSPVRRMYMHNGSQFVDTASSTYEFLAPTERLSDLDIITTYGEVHVPLDAQEAMLGNEVIEADGEPHIYVNKPALQGILLEVNGGQIFRMMSSRLAVVAKVENIHVPFYISSEGTSGKNKGEWYPFFGYTGVWLVKGSQVTKDGDMSYHPAITRIRNILNQNLIIPVDYLSEKGKLGNGYENDSFEPEDVVFDLGDVLKYQNYRFTDFYKEGDLDAEVRYVARITGYAPNNNVTNSGPGSRSWIAGIVSRIKSEE